MELLVPVTLHAAADHPAVEHVERGEQRGGAVPLVVVAQGVAFAGLQRQAGLGAVERLDLALLVDREHQAVGRRIREYAPQDTELHRIADRLQEVQRANSFQLRAGACHRGHYCHEYCMEIAVERDSSNWQGMTDGADDVVTEALRDLARWLYRQLEREWEYMMSDACVDEGIGANGYTFTEKGRRFG